MGLVPQGGSQKSTVRLLYETLRERSPLTLSISASLRDAARTLTVDPERSRKAYGIATLRAQPLVKKGQKSKVL